MYKRQFVNGGGVPPDRPEQEVAQTYLTITVLFPQRPLAPSLGVEPTMDDMMGVIRGMPNWKAVGPDSLPAEVLKLDHPEFIRYFHNLLVNVWSTGEVPQQWKDATIKVLHKKKDRSAATTTEKNRLLPTQAIYCRKW